MTLHDYNIYVSDLIFSGGGGNDEGSAAANSVMHALADGDRGVGGVEADSSVSNAFVSFTTSSSSSSSSDDSLSFIVSLVIDQDGQQGSSSGSPHPPLDWNVSKVARLIRAVGEAIHRYRLTPSLVPLAPYLKLH
ncbi:hypothetical protein Tco_0184476 [Tanacetum coccineum]